MSPNKWRDDGVSTPACLQSYASGRTCLTPFCLSKKATSPHSSNKLEARARNVHGRGPSRCLDAVVLQNPIAAERSGRRAPFYATALKYGPATVRAAVSLHFLILLVASWLGRRQGAAIAYLQAENRPNRGVVAVASAATKGLVDY